MPKMLLVFSHELTDEQRVDAVQHLNIDEVVAMPESLKKLWMNIPPGLTSLKEYLKPICNWIKEVAEKEDVVLIHGDFGATYILVNCSFKLNLIPIYATTERAVNEQRNPDGTVKIERVFKHKMFRRYEKGGYYE